MASSGFQGLFKVSSCLVEATEVVFFFSSWSCGPLKPTLDMGVRLLFLHIISSVIFRNRTASLNLGDLHTTYMRTHAVSRKTRSCEYLQKAKD